MEKQTYTRKHSDGFGVALKYYTVLCSLNNIVIGEKELLIIAYIATNEFDRKEISRTHSISPAQISNILRSLKRKQLITNELDINPYAKADFTKGITIEIILKNAEEA